MSRKHESGKWLADLKYAPGEELCNTCGVKLVPGLLKENPASNIAPSHFEKFSYLCRSCRKDAQKKQRAESKAFERMAEEVRQEVQEATGHLPKKTWQDLLREEHAKRQAIRYQRQCWQLEKPEGISMSAWMKKCERREKGRLAKQEKAKQKQRAERRAVDEEIAALLQA